MSQMSAAEALAAIRIVLVAPAGPLNIGSVARVMKNFGLSQLVLVTPQCDPLGAEALQMAVHADDILRSAQRVTTIPEALVGCECAIATTARTRGFDAPLQRPEVALPTLITPTSAPTALIFGPEDRGLSNEELTYAQAFTKIPTTDTYSALNLAQAVAICCYELHRTLCPIAQPIEHSSSASSFLALRAQGSIPSLQNAPPSDKQTESKSTNIATLDELEGYYQHLETVLLKVEYLYPHTAASRMRKLRQLLNRAVPAANEVALLRGMLRQVEWALSRCSNKGSSKGSNKG
ncbi:MAG: RNA methyltransferase [Phormidesmis sp.]